MRWEETEKKKERLSVRVRDVSCRVMGREREKVDNIIELKRWSGAISKQVGVWSEKAQARY